jgi:hypothetical protein
MSNLLFRGVHNTFFSVPDDARYSIDDQGRTVVSWGRGDDHVVAAFTDHGVVRTYRHPDGWWRTELILEDQLYEPF